MPRRQRLDAELVRRGLARSREHAADLIQAGRVSVAGAVATKAATGVTADAPIVVREGPEGPDYVSRGAYKLAGALDVFVPQGLRVEGRTALDAGASTGGFTDVLLRRGVASVLAVDVGYGQLAWALQQDARVRVFDRTNVRDLDMASLGVRPDLVVADLSFISLRLVLAVFADVGAEDVDVVVMVKPQFEVGRERLGKGGVVRDPEVRAEAVLAVAAAAEKIGFGVQGCCTSVLPGPAGNVEFFLWLRRGPSTLDTAAISQTVTAGP